MRTAVFACLLTLLCATARAQPALTQPVSDQVVTLGAAHLHLPGGAWQEVSQEDHPLTRVNGGGWFNTPRTIHVYVQTQDGRLAAIMLAATNTLTAREGWAPPRLCNRTDTYWSDHRNGWTQNYDCALVNHVVMRETSTTSDLMRAAFDAAKPSGGMPNQLIRAEFADAHARNEIRVYVAFNPALAGLEPSHAGWKASEWQASNADAAHKAYLDRIAAWAQSYRTTVRDALP